VTGLALQVPLIFNVRAPPSSCSCLDLENFRGVEDDVDAATPVDAQNAPTGVWKSRTEREIPTASTSITLLDKEENEEQRQLIPIHTNCPRDRIRSRIAANMHLQFRAGVVGVDALVQRDEGDPQRPEFLEQRD